jgi:transketolase
VHAATALAGDAIAARVVSLPSWDRFEAQGREYRDAVLPPGVPVLSVEAATTFGWERYADESVGIDRFGASAPGDVVMRERGMTQDAVVARAKTLLGG